MVSTVLFFYYFFSYLFPFVVIVVVGGGVYFTLIEKQLKLNLQNFFCFDDVTITSEYTEYSMSV